jgi:hypothetical protein
MPKRSSIGKRRSKALLAATSAASKGNAADTA